MKSGNLNFVEPSGPLQACKGTAAAAMAMYLVYDVRITDDITVMKCWEIYYKTEFAYNVRIGVKSRAEGKT